MTEPDRNATPDCNATCDPGNSPADEPLDLRQLYREAPVLTVLAAAGLTSFAGFLLLNRILGGDAAGTLPSQQGFVVDDRGTLTPVSEGTWLFSLCCSVASNVLGHLPLLVLLAVTQRHRLRTLKHYFMAAFLVMWQVGWTWIWLRDGIPSLLDWLRLP